MTQKINGISFWGNLDTDLEPQFDNEGWVVGDAGEAEDEVGFTLIFSYTTPKGKTKRFYSTLSEQALIEMLIQVRLWANSK